MNADILEPTQSPHHLGLQIALAGVGRVQLTQLLAKNSETAIYRTTYPGIVVKIFDLNCGKPDEISYGPYMSFTLEQANFEDILEIPDLRPLVPAYYGSNIDYEKKYAFIAMEYLEGADLKSWCEQAALNEYQAEWITEFKQAIHESMAIIRRFHKHGIVLVDFKPDNIIRLSIGGIRMVDLGAFFTPRHYGATDKYVYSATPDYAELLIDASNVQAGLPPTEASDIFSVGVAWFEMATGGSRLEINPATAQEILQRRDIYLFRDSQIRDIWRSYPHLMEALPTVETQLRENRVLFSELWHLLKSYVASQVPDWEILTSSQRDEIILETGTTFIMEQLPERLQWLASPIARATVLRSIRVKTIAELMQLVESPIGDDVQFDLRDHNSFFDYLCDRESSSGTHLQLNTWDVRFLDKCHHWAISASAACRQLQNAADSIYLKKFAVADHGDRFYQPSDEFHADQLQDAPLILSRLRDDHSAWLGP
jgi:serine/threonine protein kinase